MIEYTSIKPDTEIVVSDIKTLCEYFAEIEKTIKENLGVLSQDMISNDIRFTKQSLDSALVFVTGKDPVFLPIPHMSLDELLFTIFMDYTHSMLMLNHNYYNSVQISGSKIAKPDDLVIGRIITALLFIFVESNEEINDMSYLLKEGNAVLLECYGVKIPNDLLPMLTAHRLKS